MLEKTIAAIALVLFIAASVICMLPGSFTDIAIRDFLTERIPFSTFLLQHPFITVIGGLLLSLFVVVLPRGAKWVFLVLYIVFILYMTLLFRKAGESRGVFEVFYSYRKFFSSSYYRQEILQNIWLFVPLGAALYSIFKRRWVIVLPLVLSGVIELIQFFLGIGVAELDDIISNALGGVIGVYLALLFSRKHRTNQNS